MPDITITLSDEDAHLWAQYKPPAYATVLDRAESAMADACRQWVEDNKPIPEEPPMSTDDDSPREVLFRKFHSDGRYQPALMADDAIEVLADAGYVTVDRYVWDKLVAADLVEPDPPIPEEPPIGTSVTAGGRVWKRVDPPGWQSGLARESWAYLNEHMAPVTIVEPEREQTAAERYLDERWPIVEPDPYLHRPWGRHAADPVPGDKDYEPKSRVREMIDVIEEQMDDDPPQQIPVGYFSDDPAYKDDPPQRTEWRMWTTAAPDGTRTLGVVIKAADLVPGVKLAGGIVEKITRVESDGYICAYAGSTTLWSGWPNSLVVLEES